MPIVQVTMLEGRTPEKKRAMLSAVTEAIVESLGAPRESIRVMIHEVPKNQYAVGGKTAEELGR